MPGFCITAREKAQLSLTLSLELRSSYLSLKMPFVVKPISQQRANFGAYYCSGMIFTS
jgi:hypothetical protein